ncbi:MAG: hypothetical protein U5L45_16730 [Saprospiraceae bacterium]|nr:hypothetical protein [Saprospiraceae bacterium]
MGIIDGFLKGGLNRGTEPAFGAKRHIDDIRTVIGGVPDRQNDVVETSVAILVKNLVRHNLGSRRDARNSDTIIHACGDSAGNMRSCVRARQKGRFSGYEQNPCPKQFARRDLDG